MGVWAGTHKPGPANEICQNPECVHAIFDVLEALHMEAGQHIVFVLLDLLARTLKAHDLKRRANTIWRRIKGNATSRSTSADVKSLIRSAEPEKEQQREEPQAKRLKISVNLPEMKSIQISEAP